MSESKIKAGKNGCASEVIFFGRKIYQDCEDGDGDIYKSELGMKLCTIKWIENRVTDKSKLNEVMDLFSHWQLYENGWYVLTGDGYENMHLWYHLCQIGKYSYCKPKALNYIKKYNKNDDENDNGDVENDNDDIGK